MSYEGLGAAAGREDDEAPMTTPCNTCPRSLTCPNHRACAAWLWWWADRWREAAERIAEMAEIAEMEGWL